MAETAFELLSVRDRREALSAAQQASGRRAFLLEKDVWIVRMLRILFDAPFGADLVFKGGTSLAKAYHAIRRFSEDIDVTYDIRAFAPDLVTGAGGRWIDYRAAVSGGMQLVPEGFARDALRGDYERMVSGGMLDDAEPFDMLIDCCTDLETRANDV